MTPDLDKVDEIAITDHVKIEKEIAAGRIKNLMQNQDGALFKDKRRNQFRLVNGAEVIVFDIQDNKAVVITAFTTSDTTEHHRKRRYQRVKQQ